MMSINIRSALILNEDDLKRPDQYSRVLGDFTISMSEVMKSDVIIFRSMYTAKNVVLKNRYGKTDK